MKSKKLSAILIILMLSAVTISIVFEGINRYYSSGIELNTNSKEDFFLSLEEEIKTMVPYNSIMEQATAMVLYETGNEYQENLFIAQGYLMEDVRPSDYQITYNNSLDIKEFVSNYRIPTYVMIVPSSCAINQKLLSDYNISHLFNQKQYIEDIYGDFQGSVSTVNVYPTLFNNSHLPLYYKTQSSLTSQGAYYVYQVLATRLKLEPNQPERYDITLNYGNFYGDLFENSPYKEIPQDSISLYYFNRYDQHYLVEITDINGEVYSNYQLYQKDNSQVNNPMDVFLGGDVKMVQIETLYSSDSSLLVIGDKNTTTYLPFLANHYGSITYINSLNYSEDLDISVDKYDQILFAFDVDSYMNSYIVPKI